MSGTASAPTVSGLNRLLGSPVAGMAPWIVFSLLAGPGRFEIAVALALACSLALVLGGRLVGRGGSWKLLELSDLAFFSGMAVLGALADDSTLRWLETYAGEVSNIALVLIAFGSMAAGAPFTLPYARERVDPAHWGTPAFLRANQVVTGVWGAAFLVAAISGGYGILVLHNPNNLWTGWIIQALAIVAAARFTEWYPEAVRARARRDSGRPGAGPPPLSALLLPLAGLLIPAGIAVLVLDSVWWLGVLLIMAGTLLTTALRT
ncbi:hypothetical protein [Streptomyces sp. NPDC086787]|uniref:hypothetical protein n=1 Tax=Streptomyces sp. NPDC086787 TaxID=3365759 RepID=UPI00381C57B9